MRARFVLGLLALCLLTAGVPARFDNRFHPPPTHEWPFQTVGSVASTRGGSSPTFTRATAASRNVRGSLGTMATVASGTAIISTPLDEDGTLPQNGTIAYRAGEAVSYVLLRNTAIDNAAWSDVSSPTVTADVTTDMFGNSTFDDISDDSGAAVEARSQAVTIADDSSTWVASVWTTCASTHSVDFTLALSGGTPVTTTTTFTCSGQLIKVTAEAVNNGTGNTTATVTLRGTQDVASETGACRYTYAQLYNESFVTSVDVETAGAAVTVNTDDLTFATVAANDIGSFCTWVWSNQEDNPYTEVRLAGWDGTNDLLMFLNSDGDSGQARLELSTGSLAANTKTKSSGSLFQVTQWNHVCFSWNAASGVTISHNGVEATYLDETEVFSTGGDYGTTFRMGPTSTVSGEYFFARAKYWAGTRLSAAQMRKLYHRERQLGMHSGTVATGDGLPAD